MPDDESAEQQTVDEAQKTEQDVGLDVGAYLIVIGVALVASLVFILIYYPKALAAIGLGNISAGFAPLQAAGNGLAQAISAFFNWVSNSFSHL